MKKYFVSAAVVLVLVVLSACNGDSSSPTEPLTGRGQSFDLRVGQTVKLDGDVGVTLVGIVADSRCPITALCADPGFVEAEIQVRQASGGTSSGVVRLDVGKERQEVTQIGRYAFQMGKQVKPSKENTPIPQSSYEITLTAFAR
jgi:hypothetical protein